MICFPNIDDSLTHLPDVFGRVWLVQHELGAVLVVLALDAEEPLVVDQVGDVLPLEELGGQHVALPHDNA